MTAAVLDPASAIAAAGRELLDSLRQMVDKPADDVPGLLDELTAVLRRARGKVNRAAKKAAEEAKAPAKTLESASSAGQQAAQAPASSTTPVERPLPLGEVLAPYAKRTADRRAQPCGTPSAEKVTATVGPKPGRPGGHRRPRERLVRWLRRVARRAWQHPVVDRFLRVAVFLLGCAVLVVLVLVAASRLPVAP